MARKPIPGDDKGTWGEILNEYLDVAHAADGTLKNNSVTESKLSPDVRAKLNNNNVTIANGSVTTDKLADGSVTNAKIAGGAAISQSKIANLPSDLASKADATHNHSAAEIVSGVIDPARLGSGQASGSTVLYGDGSWKAAPSGGVNATNLTATVTPTAVVVNSDTGTDATLAAATSAGAGVMSVADKVKLDSISSGATANASDSQLRDRSTHTGTQSISTIANLQAELDGKEDIGAVSAHEGESDPHASAGYAMMLGGGRRIFVQSTDPGAQASDGDIWIDTAAQA